MTSPSPLRQDEPQRYVALLRGINVGSSKSVSMADLSSLMTSLGFSGVKTVLRSGNVIFDTPEANAAALEDAISRSLSNQLGVDADCLVRTCGELQSTLATNTLGSLVTDESKMLAIFTSLPIDEAMLDRFDPVAVDPGHVSLGDRVIYQWCPLGILASAPLTRLVEKNLPLRATARNFRTLGRLAALLRS